MKKRTRVLFPLMAIFLAICTTAIGQTSITMTAGTQTVNLCTSGSSGTIYDNGGPNGSYGNNFDGYVVLEAAFGVSITLTGSYETENGYDKIYVYDGPGSSSPQLGMFQGTGTLNVTATSGAMTVYFHTDGSSTRSGFALNYSTDGAGSLCANAPADLAATNITSRTADLGWTASGSGTFMVKVSSALGTQRYFTTQTSLALTGLHPNTQYRAQVVDVRDSASPCCSVSTSFFTLCGPSPLPIVENFEGCGSGNADAFPRCWSRVKNYDNSQYPYVETYNNEKVMRMYCGNLDYHYSIAILPEADVEDLSQCFLRFRAYPESYYTRLEIGVCDDTTLIGHGFTPVDTIDIGSTSGSWHEYIVSLANYTGSGRYVAIRFSREMQNYNGTYVRIDDVALNTCGIESLGVNYRLHDRVNVYFTTFGSPTVDLEYGPQGFTPGTGTTVANITSPHTVEGLTPNTTYTFRLTPSCGENLFLQGQCIANGTTLALRDTVAPICDDFSTNTIGSLWLRLGGSSYWSTNSNDWHRSSGGYCTGNNTTAYLVSPRMADSLNTLNVGFWGKVNSSYTNRTIQIATTRYPEQENEYHYVGSVAVQGNTWRYYQVSLADAPAGDDYIVIRTNATNDYMMMDELTIARCIPSNVRVYGVTDHEATVAWQGTERVAVIVGEDTVVATNGPFTLTGLPADSTFTLWVQGDCEGAGCPEPFIVTTLDAQQSVPYCQGFEETSAGQLPDRWVTPYLYDGCPQVYNSSNYAYQSNRSLRMYSYRNNSSSPIIPTYAAMPLIGEDDLSSLYVSFRDCIKDYYSNSSAYNGVIEVGVMEDPYDTSTFVPVATYSHAAANTWYTRHASLASYTGTGRYLAFRYRMTYNGYCYARCHIDHIRVSHSYMESGTTIRNTTDTSITLDWRTRPANTPVRIQMGDTVVNIYNDSTYTFTGLTPNTSYEFFVTTIDGDYCIYDWKFTRSTFAEVPQIPYCDDFNSYSNNAMPTNWTKVVSYGDYPRVWDNSSMTIDFGAANGDNIYALPAFEGEISDLTLQFRYRHYHDNTMLIVGVVDIPHSALHTFTPVDTLDFSGQSNSQFYDFTVSMAGYTGTGRHIAFRFISTSSSVCNGWLDDLKIFHCRLTNPRVYNVTNNSATVSWSGYPDSITGDVWIEYGPRNFTVGDSSATRVLATTNPFNITGLEEDTDYDFVFVSDCGGGSCSHPRVQIHTMSFASQPTLCYTFETEASNTMPEGWTILARYNDYPRVWHDSRYACQSDGYMDLRSYNCSGNDYRNVIVSPLLQVEDMSELYVSFRYRFNDNNSNVRLVVGVMDDPADMSTFVGVDTIRQNRDCCQYYTYSGSLASYAGTGRYLAFVYYSLSCNSSYLQMDNLTLSLCRIDDVHFYNPTTHSIDVSWAYPDANYAGDGVIIEYGTEPFAYGTGTRVLASGSPFTLDNLEAGQQYYIYVVPHCDNSADCATESYTYSTKEQDLLPPFCQDFYGQPNGSFPADWYRPLTYNGTPQVSTSSNHTASTSLQLSAVAGQPSMAVVPAIDVEHLGSLYFSFWAYMPQDDCLLVGAMENPYDTSTFVLIDTIRMGGHSRWEQQVLSLASYAGAGHYVAFRFSTASTSARSVYVDDISLRDCQIAHPRVHHVSQTSAEVSWDNVGTPYGVWVEYAPVGSSTGDFTPGNGTRVLFQGVTDGIIHGLTAATYYAFHIWVQCDSTQDECSFTYINAQTLHPFIAFPSCEDFEECANNQNTIMSNWRRLSTYSASTPYVCSVNGSNVLRFDANAGSYSIAIMPGMEVTDECSTVSGKTVRFFAYSLCYPADSGYFEVGVMEDVYDASTFVPVDTVHGLYGQWAPYLVSLESYQGTGSYIAFRYSTCKATANYILIDNLCVEPCVAADIRVSSVDQDHVTITWTGVGNPTVECEYGPSGFQRGEGTVVRLTSSPATIAGLDASTSYQFYFNSVCACETSGSVHGYTPGGSGGGNYWYGCDSCWWNWGWGWGGGWGGSGGGGGGGGGIGTTVITPPDPVTLPYCDDFEEYASSYFPRSWSRVHGSNTQYPRVTTSRYHSRSSCMEFYSAPSSDEHTRSFALLPPQGPIDVSQVVLKFWAMANNAAATQANAGFYVGVMTDPMDTSTFVSVARVVMNAANQWEEKVVDFGAYSGTGRYIAFKYAPRGEAYNTYVDDIFLGYCAASNVRYSNATGSSVAVSWTAHNSPAQVTVTYGEQGFDPESGEGTTVVCTSNPFTITGLDNSQSYDFYLTALCDDGNATCFIAPYTLNPSISAPYCENFDGIINGLLPDNWMRRQANGNNLRVENGELRMSPSSGAANRRFAILPPLRGDSVRNMMVSFRSKVNNINYAQISVGVISDTSDLSSYQEIATVSHSSTTAWKQQTVSLASYTGTGDRIAIVASSSSGSRECYIDNLVINHFSVPTGISVHHLSSERVLIVWNHDNNRTQEYTVEYGRSGFDSGTQVDAHGDSVILTGLRPGTQYEYFFRMGSHTNDCQRFQFSTLNKTPLPYCEDFDYGTADGTMPEGWSKFGNCTSWYNTFMPCVNTHLHYSGNNSMEIRFSSSSGQYAYAVMPEFDVDDVSHLNFSMMVYCEGYSAQKKLIFGVMEDRNDRNSFVPCDTLLFTNGDDYNWVRRTASLRNYTGTGRYPAFRYVATTSYNGFSIDDLKVESFPHPTITAGPDNNVILSVPSVDNVDYYIEYGRLGFVLGHGTQVHITTNLATIEGLETGATYDFYALASPTGSTCYDPVHVVIQELPRTPLPYCENFDQLTSSYQLPEGWSRIINSGTYPGSYSNYYHTSAPYAIRFDANEQVAVLPPVDVDSIKRLSLEMRLCSQSYRDNARRFVVGVMDSKTDITTFVGVDTLWFDPETTHVEHIYGRMSFHNYQGNGRFIAIKFLCNGSDWLHLDNLIIDRCPAPTVEFHNYNTVKITTSMPNPDYYIEYGPSTNVRDSNRLVHIATSPYYLTNLQPNTTYRFWPQCDSSIASSCYEYTEVRTNVQFSVPYCENFEGYGTGCNDYPANWIRHPHNNNTCELHTSSTAYSGSRGLYFECYGNNDFYYNSIAVLPDLAVDSIKDVTVSFNAYSGYASNSRFIVGVSSNPNNRYDFTPVDTLMLSSNNQWQRLSVNLASYQGRGKHIAIRFISTDGSWRSAYIDNVIVEECSVPNNATIYLASHNSVKTWWSDNETEADVWVEYGPLGFTQGEGTFVHVTRKWQEIGGLQDLSDYQFYYHCDTVGTTCRLPENIHTSTQLALPYCEGFESYGTGCNDYPVNWKRHPHNNNTCELHTTSRASSGNRGLYFECYGNDDFYYNSIAVLPDLEVDNMGDISISFDAYTSSANTSRFIVGVMGNPNNRYDFIPIDTLVITANSQWQRKQVSFARYQGQWRFVAIRFISTDGSWRSGYIDNLQITACHTPFNFQANTVAHNQIELSWDTTVATDDFFVEYGEQGFTPGTGSFIHHLTNPTLLTLDNNTTYDFYVRCDTLNAPCSNPVSATTGIAPIMVPSCIGFEEYANATIPEGWTVHTTSTLYNQVNQGANHSGARGYYAHSYNGGSSFVVFPDIDIDSLSHLTVAFWAKKVLDMTHDRGYFEVGVMDNSSQTATFVPLQRFEPSTTTYQHYVVSLSTYQGTGRFLAIRTVASPSYNMHMSYDDIYISTCGVSNIVLQDITDQSATFTWNQTGHPNISIEYGPQGFTAGTGTTVHPSSSPYTIGNLSPLTSYTFRVTSDCADLGANCSSDESKTFNIFTPVGGTGCVDYTDLTDANVTCTYGSYSNPYQNRGIVDQGSASVNSRHTVHYDTTATDPRTGNLLRVVPPGSEASVRLGNWGTNAEAESITYGLAVDTNDFDLLVLKYAAVLQDPAHGATHQPRFRIQILDSAMNLIDANCGAADFIANQNLGWNIAANYVLWKDWTTVGLDLAPYAGQRIYVRLTTFDCGESTHYGYAYFTLNCMRKSMQASGCGYVAENTFTAPSGFVYRWYSSDNMDTTLSTGQSITVESNNDITYYCDASFVDNANCYFTLAAFAGTRFPLADFSYSYTIENCQFKVQFQNNSTVSMDGETPLGTGEACESALWDFGNGLTSTSYHGFTTYASAGTYDVTLYSGLAGDACIDSITISITLTSDIEHPFISGVDEVCQGDTVSFSIDHAFSISGWNNQSAGETTTFVADSSIVLLAYVVDSNGCTDTLRHSLQVHPLALVADSHSVCQDAMPYIWIDQEEYTTEQSGTPTVGYLDRFGCDSTVALYLTINPLTSSETTDTACDNYLWNGVTYDSTGVYTYQTINAAGCDSTATLNLTVNLSTVSSTDSVACDSLVWNGATYTTSGSYAFTATNAARCDSTATLHLTVNHSSASAVEETIVENELPYTYNGTVFTEAGTYTVTIANAVGCDSVISYTLHVSENTSALADSTVCFNELPLDWNGYTFTADASPSPQTLRATVTLLAQSGADSLLTMRLTVNPTNDEHFYQTICDNESYTFADSTYTEEGSYAHILTNQYGCDSLATLHLTVNATTTSFTDSVVCDSLNWNGTIYDLSGTYTYVTSNAAACDSTATLNLTVNYSTMSVVRDTIVENSLPHTYLYETLTGAGECDLVIPNAAQCDSLIAYHLHVWPNQAHTFDSVICDDQLPLAWNDSLFTESGQKTTLFLDSHGADSLVTLRLMVHPTFDHHAYDTICEGSLSTFGGNEYGSTGDYALRYSSLQGCDSLNTLHLLVHAVTFDTICDTILENQLPYVFNGHLCLDSGTFSITIPNTMGCDSNITYHLFVHYNVTTLLDSTVCDDLLPFTWDDSLFTAETLTHTKHLLDQHGADSTVVMRLTVHPTYEQSFEQSVCSDALPFSWQGFTYEADPDTLPYSHDELLTLGLRTGQGCDSVVNLTLTVRLTSSSSTSLTVCDSHTWEGTDYTSSGTYTSTLSNALGCDSVATLALTVYRSDTAEVEVVSCGVYQWNGQDCSATGDYEYRTETSHGCDSLCVLHLRVPVIESERTEQACDSLRWNAELYTLSGDYTQQFLSVDDCDSVATLHLTVYFSSEHDEQVTLCERDLPYSYNDITYPLGTQRGMQEIVYHDRYGCDSLIHLMLDIYYNPVLSVEQTDVLCFDRRFELTATHTGDVDHVTWTSVPDDPDLAPQRESDRVAVAPTRTTLYTAEATVPGTPCSNRLSVTVDPFIALEAIMEVTPPFATPSVTDIDLIDHSRGHIVERMWLADGDYVGDSQRQMYVYPLENDSVELMLIVRESRYGCLDTARAVLPLRGGELFAPNAFTPNLSQNNLFRLYGRNIVSFEMDIYTRAGQLVFHADSMEEAWDGTHNSVPCPEASYVYIVYYTTTEATREVHTKKGTVTLLR